MLDGLRKVNKSYPSLTTKVCARARLILMPLALSLPGHVPLFGPQKCCQFELFNMFKNSSLLASSFYLHIHDSLLPSSFLYWFSEGLTQPGHLCDSWRYLLMKEGGEDTFFPQYILAHTVRRGWVWSSSELVHSQTVLHHFLRTSGWGSSFSSPSIACRKLSLLTLFIGLRCLEFLPFSSGSNTFIPG